MRMWVKMGLFLSAYFPLFLILAIKNWFNIYAAALCIIAAIYSVSVWGVLLLLVKRNTFDVYKVVKIEDKTKDTLSYLIPYIISFMGIDFTQWKDLVALAILLVILFVVYINSDPLYVNPLLSFFNYRFYSAEVTKLSYMGNPTRNFTIITQNNIKVDNTIYVWDVWENVVLEREFDESDITRSGGS